MKGIILKKWRGDVYLLLLTGDREYGETVFPSSSGRALLALTEYYKIQNKMIRDAGKIIYQK